LLGWDLTELTADADRFRTVQAQHHRNLVRQAMQDYDQVQWVVVDHPKPVDPNLLNLGNVVTDTLATVLALAPD
jgi:uncharacterized protein YejL (UPF0352 family)